MPLYVAVFISRNKDNKGLPFFKQRCKTVLVRTNNLWDEWNSEDERTYIDLLTKFQEFVDKGVGDELCRCYVSVNDRNEDKIKKKLLLYLIQNDNYDITKLDNIINSVSMDPENANHKMWLIDYDDFEDYDKVKDDIHAEAPDEDDFIVSSYQTVNGYHFVVAHGFDTRKLNQKYGDKLSVKRDGMRLYNWKRKPNQ